MTLKLPQRLNGRNFWKLLFLQEMQKKVAQGVISPKYSICSRETVTVFYYTKLSPILLICGQNHADFSSLLFKLY